MSRLEQMRQHFLQRVYSEQAATAVVSQQNYNNYHYQKSSTPARAALSSAKSLAHLPSTSVHQKISANYQSPYQQQPYHPLMRRTPSCMTTSSISSVKARVDRRNSSASNCSTGSTSLSRVKSLTSIHQQQQHLEPYRPPAPAKVSKHSQAPLAKVQPSRVNSTASSAGSKVNSSSSRAPQPPTTSQTSSTGTSSRAAVESNSGSSSQRRPSSTNSNRSSHSTRNEQASLECKHCARPFAAKERLDKHVTICAKTSTKRRPVFSSARQRGVDSSKNSDDDGGDKNKVQSDHKEEVSFEVKTKINVCSKNHQRH